MHKILEIIFSICLIIVGSFLEVIYYIERFKGDGIDFWISLIIGCALTLFLSLAVYSRNKKISKALVFSLIIYSILATSAGQHFSFQNVKNESIKTEIQDSYTIEEIRNKKNEIKELENEIKQLNIVIFESTQTLEDRWYYKNTINTAEKTKENLRSRLDEIKNELNKKTDTVKIHKDTKIKNENIYQFYNKLTFNFIPEDLLQFIFQTILSFFIATMAPLGIIIITDRKRRRITKKAKEKIINIKLSNDLIREWIQINWIGLKNKKTNKIISRENFEKFMENKKTIFTRENYDIIFNKAIRAGVIQKNGLISEQDENQAFKKINLLT